MSFTFSSKHYYRLLEWSLLLAALLFAVSFIYVAIHSMSFPFMLEWMEGQSIDVIRRVIAGEPLYARPTLDYVPLIYPPYYFYVAAFFSLVTGGDFLPARLVSFLATLGTCWIITLWLRREKAGWRLSLVGACLFLATYRLSGRWFDMSRVDSLFLFLTMAGLYVAVHGRGLVNIIVSCLLLLAAFYTKQTALVIAAPVLLALLATDARHALLTGILLAGMLLASLLLMNWASGGWLNFYLFTVPAGHRLEPAMYYGFWRNDIFRHVGIFFLMSLAMITYLLWRDWRKGLIFLGMAVGFIGASYGSRLHSYGYINVLMPMHAFLALMVGLALACCRRLTLSHVALPLAGMLVLVELSTLIYNPDALIPNERMEQAGNRFLAQVAAYNGDIFMPDIQYIQTRVGKRSFAFGMAAFDILRSRFNSPKYKKKELIALLSQAIRDKRFAAIIPGRMTPLPGLNKYYRRAARLSYPQHYVTGAIGSLPTGIYTPRQGLAAWQ